MNPVAILNAGMITGVGFDAPSSCAAIRCGINGFVETRFMFTSEELIGSPVPFEQAWHGREKLLQMVVPALEECLDPIEYISPGEIPLILCVAEPDRPGRFAGLDETFLSDVQIRLDKQFHYESTLITNGRIGGVQASVLALDMLAKGRPYCIVAGVDTYLVGATLNAYHEKLRLQTSDNSNGFIPGEAAAAVLLGPPGDSNSPHLCCRGVGYGIEPATIESEEPLRADGLLAAFKSALAASGLTFKDLDFRITDLSGEQYGFKEASLAIVRSLRPRKEKFDIWHPAGCIGEVGAAIVPCVLAVALAAVRKGYAPGPGVLCHFAADGSERAAMILRYEAGRTA